MPGRKQHEFLTQEDDYNSDGYIDKDNMSFGTARHSWPHYQSSDSLIPPGYATTSNVLIGSGLGLWYSHKIKPQDDLEEIAHDHEELPNIRPFLTTLEFTELCKVCPIHLVQRIESNTIRAIAGDEVDAFFIDPPSRRPKRTSPSTSVRSYSSTSLQTSLRFSLSFGSIPNLSTKLSAFAATPGSVSVIRSQPNCFLKIWCRLPFQ